MQLFDVMTLYQI